MLTLAEQIFIFSLDETTGHSYPLPEKALSFALAGALLMGLAAEGRIDPHITPLRIISPTLTGDKLLDDVLIEIGAHPGLSLVDYVRRITGHAHVIQAAVCRQLVERGILRKEEDTFLWVVADERFPIVDHREERAVRQRIREVVIERRVPEPQDIAIIALIEACDLMHTLLSPAECKEARPRLSMLDQLDPVGRTIIKAIAEEDHMLHDAAHALV